jgi:hypothetical protein
MSRFKNKPLRYISAWIYYRSAFEKGGGPVNDLSAFRFGLRLKPDRRQIPDRRQNRPGGRRASDRAGFTGASVMTAEEELAQVVATWGELLRLNSPSTDLRAAG